MTVRSRVTQARDRARARLTGTPWATNAEIPTARLRRDFAPDEAGRRLLDDLERRSANLRGPDRVMRLAWTIADLAGRSRPGRDEVAQALSLRGASLDWTS